METERGLKYLMYGVICSAIGLLVPYFGGLIGLIGAILALVGFFGIYKDRDRWGEEHAHSVRLSLGLYIIGYSGIIIIPVVTAFILYTMLIGVSVGASPNTETDFLFLFCALYSIRKIFFATTFG
jgi:hypothetical protein